MKGEKYFKFSLNWDYGKNFIEKLFNNLHNYYPNSDSLCNRFGLNS